MSSSNLGPISISSVTRKIEVDQRISLEVYFQIAESLLKQASIYREEKKKIDLYIMLLRFCSLTTETIPLHRDYHAFDRRKRSIFKRKLLNALEELESLKPKLEQLDKFKKKVHQPRGNSTTMSSGASSSLFDREKQEMSSPQQRPNSAGSEMSRVSISISPRSPGQSSSQSIHHDSSKDHNTLPRVNAIPYMPSPSAPPIKDLDIIDDPQHDAHSTSHKRPIRSDEMQGANASLSRSSSTTSPSCACAVCLDAPIEGACVPCGHMVGCMSCLNEIKDQGSGCPVCRTKIDLILRLYAV